VQAFADPLAWCAQLFRAECVRGGEKGRACSGPPFGEGGSDGLGAGLVRDVGFHSAGELARGQWP